MLKNRYRRILVFFARILASIFFWDILLPRFGFGRWVKATRPRRLRNIATGYHDLAVSLGGVHIKVGQFLSARMDILPLEVTEELMGLQDKVPAEDFGHIRALAEAELGAPLAEAFAEFDHTPIAAASLGQVHRAVLKEDAIQDFGRDVMVKVQRPGIEAIIETDLAALERVGGWIMRYRPVRRRADVPALLAEFSQVLYQEIDYLAEGSHARQFAENFSGVPGIRVPAVVWDQTTRRVLTLEDVYAIKISDYSQIDAAGIDRKEVAIRLFDTYMRQIFEDGFFHADPHPGNLFVDPNGDDETGWQLTFVDFGMVGHIRPNTRAGLREFLIGVGTKDSARIIKAYEILNILLPGADLTLLEQAEARVFERVWGKSMDELRDISFEEIHEFAMEYRDLVYEMPFQVPQDLIFLLRTAAILSGMCTGLDPGFNVWNVLRPYGEKLMGEETRSLTWLKEAVAILQTLISLPRQAETLFTRLNRGKLRVQAPAVELGVKQINQTLKNLVYAVIFFALLSSGVQLYLRQPDWLAYAFMGTAGLFLIAALWPRPRNR